MDDEPHGPAEEYYEDGQIREKGTYNMGEKYDEWTESDDTVTYDSCLPDLEAGNWMMVLLLEAAY